MDVNKNPFEDWEFATWSMWAEGQISMLKDEDGKPELTIYECDRLEACIKIKEGADLLLRTSTLEKAGERVQAFKKKEI